MDTEPPSSYFATILHDVDLLAISPLFLAIALLLILSGLVSGSEVSFFSLSAVQLKDLKDSKNKRDGTIIQLLETPRQLLATILISNNFINVGIVILSTFTVHEIFDFGARPVAAFVIEVVAVTSLILLFGEILPKVYSTSAPLATARIMASPLLGAQRLFQPLIRISYWGSVINREELEKSGVLDLYCSVLSPSKGA